MTSFYIFFVLLQSVYRIAPVVKGVKTITFSSTFLPSGRLGGAAFSSTFLPSGRLGGSCLFINTPPLGEVGRGCLSINTPSLGEVGRGLIYNETVYAKIFPIPKI